MLLQTDLCIIIQVWIIYFVKFVLYYRKLIMNHVSSCEIKFCYIMSFDLDFNPFLTVVFNSFSHE